MGVDNKEYLNSLIEKVIGIQYGNEDINKTDVFTKDYIDKISTEPNFYKEQLKPYRILRSSIEEIEDKPGEKFEIYVRIEDVQGEYFQVLHITKINEKFYVDNIEYDI